MSTSLSEKHLAPPDAERVNAESPARWRWSQQWRDVLFLHWPAPPQWLSDQLPAGLAVDTFQGEAWVSLVGFRLQQVRLRGWPALPFCSQMLELNFRTYVRHRGEPAIHFLAMHADHRLLVAAARCLTPLPYSLAQLAYAGPDTACSFFCRPHYSRTPLLAAQFSLGDGRRQAIPGTLDDWLTERYVAYVAGRDGDLLRMPVSHESWRLREIALRHCELDLQPLHGRPALCHYSDGVSALLWPFETIGA